MRTRWTFLLLGGGCWIGCAAAVHARIVRPLQTLSNMLAAIREQDYSLRARHAGTEDALGLAMLELNALMHELRDRRLGALEAGALLRRVMGEIDVVVLAFDDADALRLVNAAGERLLGQPAERLLARRADELGLSACLTGTTPRVIDGPLAGQEGRWELRYGDFRQDGRPHRFVLLADVSRALREEERLAWQRIIRVLGHEINNSLTPIHSLADRLRLLVQRGSTGGESPEDLMRGLEVIATRSASLMRFMAAYTRLARLPAPRGAPVSVAALVRGVVALESRLAIRVVEAPDITVWADGDQLSQLLINLLSNAVDAALVTGGGVTVRWERRDHQTDLVVDDEGVGLPDSSNLFVPFFTTKPGGTGIGLVLARQIAEAHGGTLTLRNRPGAPGCEARLTLPDGALPRPA